MTDPPYYSIGEIASGIDLVKVSLGRVQLEC